MQLLYPEEADEIMDWMAHKVQRPEIKINHVVTMGGSAGIGKDWLMQALKLAVGAWNFQEVFSRPPICWRLTTRSLKLLCCAHERGPRSRRKRPRQSLRPIRAAESLRGRTARCAGLQRQVHPPALRAKCARADRDDQSQRWHLFAA